MKKYLIAGLAFLCAVASAQAGVRHGIYTSLGGSGGGSTITYANACGTTPVGQNWCVGTDGWTVFTPTIGSAGTTCAQTGAPTWDGTCVIYIAEGGTGTLATCRVAATAGFDFAFDPTVGGTVPTAACPYQATYMNGVRTNSPDYLLFKRGDCFVDALAPNPCSGGSPAASTNSPGGICAASGFGCNWSKVGKSANEPMVIGAFGPLANPRPKFITLSNLISTQSTFGNFIAITSLHSKGGELFINYTNTTYNPGFMIAGVAAAGQQIITNATASPTTPLIRLTMGSTANLAGPVTVASVGGVAAANGTWASYTVIDGTTIDLVGSTFSGSYTSGGTLGIRQITLPSVPSTSLINSVNVQGWGILNFSNRAQVADGQQCANTSLRFGSISGAVVTLLSNIPTNRDITVGDRLLLVPYNCNIGGMSLTGSSFTWTYVEDMWLEGGSLGIIATTPQPVQAFIRRNIISNVSSYVTRNQGMFLADNFHLSAAYLVEENVIHHSGWIQLDNDCVPARFMPAKCSGVASPQLENSFGQPNDQAQNAYDHENCCFMTFQRNISTDATGTTTQIRSGGILYNNFLARSTGGQTGGGIVWPNTASYNVFADNTASYMAIMPVTGVAGNTLTFDHVPGSMSGTTIPAVKASVVTGGSGYTNGTQTLTVSNGCTTPAQFSVSVIGGVVQGFPRPVIVVEGVCGSAPANTTGVTGGGGTGATLFVSYGLTGISSPFNASNPTGINQSTNTTFTSTPTTVTINGPAITASVGDMIYFYNNSPNPHYGYSFGTAWTNPPTVSVNAANSSNVQWNIHTGAIPKAYIGGAFELGYAFNSSQNAIRATGNVFSNNYIMNQPSTNADQGGVVDQTQITSVDGTGCSGNVRIGVQYGLFWNVGDAIVVSGTAPSSMNANVTSTVASISGNFLCLTSAPFGSGTWTSGTGVINGGIAWGPNWYYNTAQPLYVTPSTSTATSALPTLNAFTPLTTTGCPQATGCPSVEGYMASLGLSATLSDFVAQAKLNRRGVWDTRFTAATVNNYIRSRTSAAIALQPQ